MRSGFVFSTIAFSLLGLTAAGCFNSDSDEAQQPVGKPFEGQSIVIAVPAGYGFEESWELVLQEWSEQTGAACEVREYDPNDREQPLSARLGAGEEAVPALFVAGDSEMPDLVAAGIPAPVPPEERSPEALNWLDVFDGLREQAIVMGRREYAGVPLSAPVPVCYYRKDLLEKARLDPPRTWADYHALLESRDEWAPGLTAVEPWGADFRATMFLARAAAYAKHPDNYSFYFDITTGDPLIDTPGFVRALQETLAAVESMPEEVKSYSPRDCRRELLAGRAALGISFERAAGERKTPEETFKRPAEIELGFARLPGVVEPYNRSINAWQQPAGTARRVVGRINQVTLTGFAGFYAGVSAKVSPRKAAAAWNLLGRLVVDEIDTFPPETVSLTRESQIETAAGRLGRGLQPDETYRYLNAVAESLRDGRLVRELPVIGRDRFRQALTEELSHALDGKASPQESLEAAAGRWRQISAEIGIEQLVDSYRKSLGLSPRR